MIMSYLRLSLFLILLPVLAQADAQMTRIYDLLRMSEYAAINRDEGMADGIDVASDMLERAPGPALLQQIDHIHDPARVNELLRQRLDKALHPSQRAAVLGFLSSELGLQVMEIELSARRAFSDPDIEEAAITRWHSAQADPGNDALLKGVDTFSDLLDLVERNVAGALNAQMMFFNGLADGGAIEMTEADILAQVWGQEADMRTETEDWLGGYLFLAYGALSADEFSAYLLFSQSPAGQALNNALFAAFNALYDEQSYALGRVIALNMSSEDI